MRTTLDTQVCKVFAPWFAITIYTVPLPLTGSAPPLASWAVFCCGEMAFSRGNGTNSSLLIKFDPRIEFLPTFCSLPICFRVVSGLKPAHINILHAHISICPHIIHWQIIDFCMGTLKRKCWAVDNLRGIYWDICWDYVGMGIILIICGKYVGRSLIFCPWIPHILYILLLVSSTLKPTLLLCCGARTE